jgi:hypothetical protein
MIHQIRHALAVMLHRRRTEQVLQDELNFHFEQLTNEKVAG